MDADEQHKSASETSVSFEYEAFGGVYKWKVEADVATDGEGFFEVTTCSVYATDDIEIYDLLPVSLQQEIDKLAEEEAEKSY